MGDADRLNLETWEQYAADFAVEGWLDPAEPAALLSVADAVRGGTVLDLGVGAGRTTALLRLLSADYLGLDYAPAMVRLAQERHPTARIRLGDARAMVEVPDQSVDLVYFSNNGLDSMDHEDRQRALAEIARVLRPGGQLLLTTLNLDGELFGVRPDAVPAAPWRSGLVQGFGSVPAAELAAPADPEQAAALVRNWRARSKLASAGPGWAVGPLPAYGFRVLAHFIALPALREELRHHGLQPVQVWGADSPEPLPDGSSGPGSWYFYVTATRERSSTRSSVSSRNWTA